VCTERCSSKSDVHVKTWLCGTFYVSPTNLGQLGSAHGIQCIWKRVYYLEVVVKCPCAVAFPGRRPIQFFFRLLSRIPLSAGLHV
jgi:hypothetical protein